MPMQVVTQQTTRGLTSSLSTSLLEDSGALFRPWTTRVGHVLS